MQDHQGLPDGLQIRGRIPRRSAAWSREQAMEYVAQYRASGKKLAEFAKSKGVSTYQLRGWVNRLSSRQAVPAAAPQFVEVTARPAAGAKQSSGWVDVLVERGVRVRVYESSSDAHVLRVVRLLQQEGAESC